MQQKVTKGRITEEDTEKWKDYDENVFSKKKLNNKPTVIFSEILLIISLSKKMERIFNSYLFEWQRFYVYDLP